MSKSNKKQPIPSSDELLVAAQSDSATEEASSGSVMPDGLDPEQTSSDSAEASVASSDDSDQLIDMQRKLAAAEKEILRVQADMENFRKRTRRDMQDQIRYATLPLITELIEVIDNLQRAIESAEHQTTDQALLQGVKMVAQQLNETLLQHGCHPIESVGQPFDPNLHEAIQMQPSDEFEANTVSRQTRTGYKLHERVIRPAQVFISTGPSKD